MGIDGGSRVLGVFGDPVAHSLSPFLHARFAEDTGVNSVYVPFHVRPEGLEQALFALPALGIRGVNITVPHKEAVYRLLAEHSTAARHIGAVNTVINDDGVLWGDNTDAAGFLEDIRACFPDRPWEHGGAVILGAGGAARAVVHALSQAGIPLVVANRDPDKARALVQELAPETGRPCGLDRPDLAGPVRDAGLLVNTTSVGLEGDRFPDLPLEQLSAGAAVYDLIYSPARTPLLQAAEQLGLAAANGLGMLVRQGAHSFWLWNGAQPPVDAVLEHLRADLGVGSPG
jgi:shikimate dehydrogenase